jgi:RimJ/RimL family protein N-acetyltransferase
MFEKQLFLGEHVRLAAPDAERDAEIESKWTLDLDYLHAINVRPAYPVNTHFMKKQYEEQQKEAEKNKLFWWAVRLKAEDRLIGWLKINNVEWPHGSAEISLAIGAPADRNHGYGSDVMRLAFEYAFNEMNLHRLRAVVPGYNAGAERFFKRFGFVEEVRRREALLLHGNRYDELWLGLLRRDYRPLPLGEGRGEGGR